MSSAYEEPTAAAPDSKAFRRSVFSGLRWSATGQLVEQATKLITAIWLARILAPEVFGLTSMAEVFIGFINVFQFLGTNAVLQQRKEVSRDLIDSLVTMSVVWGFFLSGLFVVTGPLMGRFFRSAELVPVVQVLGVNFVLQSFALVQRELMKRDLHFARLVMINLVTSVTTGALAISLAYLGWGVWSLVTSSLLWSILTTVLSVIYSPSRVGFGFRWSEVRGVMGFSSHIIGSSAVLYFSQRADDLIIGRALGTTALGYYSVAYRIFRYPQDAVTRIVMRVMFPAFSRIQDDLPKLARGFLRVNGGIAFLAVPFMFGASAVAGPLVRTFLGARWEGAIPVVTILAAVGVLHTLSMTPTYVFLALGFSGLRLTWGIISAAVLVSSFLIGVQWGIQGVATAYAIALVPLFIGGVHLAMRLLHVPVGKLYRELAPYLACGAVMVGAVVGVRVLLAPHALGSAVVLALCVLVGGAVYLTGCWLLGVPALRDTLELVAGRVSLRRKRGTEAP